MKKWLILCSLLLIVHHLIAQKKELSLDDAVLRGRTLLSPKRLNQLSFIPHSDNYVFTYNNKLVVTNPNTNAVDSIDVVAIVNSQIKDIELTRFPLINWRSTNEFYFVVDSVIYTFNIASMSVSRANTMHSDAEDVDIHDATLNCAYTLRNSLYVSINNEQILIAEPETDGIVYGKSVHRQEFGIEKGTFWNHTGTQLALYRMNETMVAKYPIYVLESKPAAARYIRYPMAGATSHHVDIYVYDTKTRNHVKLDISGPDDQYLTNISWSIDDKYISVAILNRDQNYMQLNIYDAQSGKFVKTLFEEKNDKYVEPLHPAIFTKDNKHILWQSQRDGYNSIYVYDWNGKLIRQLTKDVIVLDYITTDESGSNIYLNVVKPNSLTHYCITVNINTGKTNMLFDDKTNVVQSIVSDRGSYSILHQSNSTIPRRYTLVQQKKNIKLTRILYEPENPLTNYLIGTTEISTIKATDGTLLYQRLIKPQNFDAAKKYPVIVYVYGGPHAQMITDAYLNGGELWMHYLANKGFLIYTIDNRGSANRGLVFEQATFRHLGNIEMQDQMTGVNYLKSLSYVDANRLGVDGWSFGGFMTISLMTRQNNTFKVAVAGGPVIDWAYYEVMYTERYMDTPQTNESGYKESSLFNYIDNLNGRLLIIHGTSDDVVLWQHSLEYIQQCVKKEKQLDYFVYPEHEHNVLGPDRLHLMRKITDYFIEHL